MYITNNKTLHNGPPSDPSLENLPKEINHQEKMAVFGDMLTEALCTI